MSKSDLSGLMSVAQAIRILDATPVTPGVRRVRLGEAQGLILAADLKADRDYPPFDKSLMDGFAVRCADVARTPVKLRVVGQIAAGDWPRRGIRRGEAMAIMTGAPLPRGADGVVPIEDVERAGVRGKLPIANCRLPIAKAQSPKPKARHVGAASADQSLSTQHSALSTDPAQGTWPRSKVIVQKAVDPARYVARRGADMDKGTVVLRRGMRLEAAQLAVAASIGASDVPVYVRPKVAVLSTGDELVPIDARPAKGQIRTSNNVMLAALARRMGCDVVDLGTAPDEPKAIRAALKHALSNCDVLLVSGGMSVGEYDYVPAILGELGVKLKITKLRIKPGKPFVFGMKGSGVRGQGSGRNCRLNGSELGTRNSELSYVFGLPGNPVSGFVCTMRLASRIIARLGGGDVEERWITGKLAKPLLPNGPREFYQPVKVEYRPSGQMIIRPLGWKGSADVFTLAVADGLLVRKESEPALPAGASVMVLEV